MADVPGVCELPLTRAVVQYRDLHEIDYPGGRIQDIGLALVLQGRYASSAQVVDLILAISFYNAASRTLNALRIDVEDSYQKYLEQFPLP